MSNARSRLAFARETMFSPCGSFFSKTRETVRLTPGEPPGSPGPLPLVRFADKALRAFPNPLPAHEPEDGS